MATGDFSGLSKECFEMRGGERITCMLQDHDKTLYVPALKQVLPFFSGCLPTESSLEASRACKFETLYMHFLLRCALVFRASCPHGKGGLPYTR